jgi:hypothetical protein
MAERRDIGDVARRWKVAANRFGGPIACDDPVSRCPSVRRRCLTQKLPDRLGAHAINQICGIKGTSQEDTRLQINTVAEFIAKARKYTDEKP